MRFGSFVPTASQPHSMGGEHHIFTFANGYGASVVRFAYSYGGDRGLWELAVVEMGPSENPWNFELTYATPVTDDVLGYLTESDVEKHLNEIAALPQRALAAR